MIAVIVNPRAQRALARRDLADRLRGALGDRGEVIVTRDLDDLSSAVGRLARRGCETLAIAGGDGTISRTLGAWRAAGDGALPRVLPLPCGTINGVVSSIGGSGRRPERALERFLQGEPAEIVERSAIEVEGRELGFLFGLGVGVDFLVEYYRLPATGAVPAAGLLARAATSALARGALAARIFRGFRGEVRVDGEPLPFERYSLLLGMSIEHLPLGFRAGYRATLEAERFQVLAGAMSAAEVVANLHRFRFGWPVSSETLADRLVSRVEIRFAEPTRWMLDAEIHEPVRALSLRTGPRVRFVVP